MISSKQNYNTLITVAASPTQVFRAITQEIAEWWGSTDKPITGLGDIFTVSWGKPWYQFEVIACEPYRRVEWKCLDANQIIPGLEGIQKEWVGSEVIWTIQSDIDNTNIQFEHRGMTPALICHDFCTNVWSEYLHGSFRNYLQSG